MPPSLECYFAATLLFFGGALLYSLFAGAIGFFVIRVVFGPEQAGDFAVLGYVITGSSVLATLFIVCVVIASIAQQIC